MKPYPYHIEPIHPTQWDYMPDTRYEQFAWVKATMQGFTLISAYAFTYNALIQSSFDYKVKPVNLMEPTFYSDRHYRRKLWET